MSKVTALGMDVITQKSGHVATPMAPSVCTTPAAPAPIPVPYRYTWDAAGRLAGVVLPDGRKTEYAYDPLARRTEARLYGVRSFGSTPLIERTRCVWDGDTLAHAIRARAAADGDSIIEERTFCFQDRSFVPSAQCDDVPDGYGGRTRTWSFFVNDPIGTPDEMVGGDGKLLAELDRMAWGQTELVEGAQAETPLRFQGQHEDTETRLFYNLPKYKSRKCAKDAAGPGADERRKPHAKRVPGGQTGHFHADGGHDSPRDEDGNELDRQDRNVHYGFGPAANRLRPGEAKPEPKKRGQ